MDKRTTEFGQKPGSSKSAAIKHESESMNPRDGILKLLQQAKKSETSGSFATSGECASDMTMPGLRIEDIGNVGLPLSGTTALDVLRGCRRAKCNFDDAGASAVMMEMDPSSFSLENPSWEYSIQQLAARTCSEKLGVQEQIEVKAELQKLVILEKGSMYHQIPLSEEKSNVFGTLIVALPSNFEGGNIVALHEGRCKTVLSHSDRSPYTSQYAVFYNDCKLKCHPITQGHCLCLIYHLGIDTKSGPHHPLPSAAGNIRLSMVRQLRATAESWNANFDGNKLVILVDHVNRRNSNFQGDDKAVIQLLKLAVKEGVDLDWSRGTIKYRIYGHGMGPVYCCEWGGTELSKTTLHLQRRFLDDGDDYIENKNNKEAEDKSDSDTCGDSEEDEDKSDSDSDASSDDYVNYDCDYEFDAYDDYDDGDMTFEAATEMIPPDFYDNETPEEEFEDSEYGIKAKRTYENQKAIVLWPKSWSWRLVTNGDLSEMCRFVLRQPDVQKTEMLSDLILGNECGRSDGIVSVFFQLVMTLGDQDIAVTFWKEYLVQEQKAGRVPGGILAELGPFMETFGANDDVQLSLTESIPKQIVQQSPNIVIPFVSACVKSLSSHPRLCQQMLEKLVESLDCLESTISAPSAKVFFGLFEKESDITGVATIVSRFLDSMTRASCQHRSDPKIPTVRGPVELLDVELSKVCAVLGWQDIKKSLTNAILKLAEHGSFEKSLKLVKELSGPNPELLDPTGNQYKVCVTCAERSLDAALSNIPMQRRPSVQAILDVFFLLDVFCPSKMDSFVHEVLKMNIDETIAPLALKLRKPRMSSELQRAIAELASPCVEVLLARLSVPDEDAVIWSSSLTANTRKEERLINEFLRSPCKSSLSFELAAHSHKQLLDDLQPLISDGYIKAYIPPRPNGVIRWSMKIDKLNYQRQSAANVASLTCSCYPSDESAGRCIVSACRNMTSKRQKDDSTLQQLLSLVPTEGTEHMQRKRKRGVNEPQDGENEGEHRSWKCQPEVIVIDN